MATGCTTRSRRFRRLAGAPALKCYFAHLVDWAGSLWGSFSTLTRIFFFTALIISFPIVAHPQALNRSTAEGAEPIAMSTAGGISEQIPNKYRGRYDRWKGAFLSAPSGRLLWSKYATNPSFNLMITVSQSQGQGAQVNDYQLNDGKLVAATITLGHELDYGYPGGPYYPVLGALAFTRSERDDRASNILAAAKIAHEFGHVDNAINSDATTYWLQNVLSQVYAAQFQFNGNKIADPGLVELAGRMGGTPPEIRGQRECWAETYTLRYLLDKLSSEKRRRLLKLVRKSLETESLQYSLPSKAQWLNLVSTS